MSTTGRWPDFFVVGAPRCATTSLYQYLRLHPDLYLPDRKELNLFLRPWEREDPRPERLVEEERRYLGHFVDARDHQVVGEVSTGYLRGPDVPHRIHERVPEARIIVLLRDPVERAHSNYLSQHRKGRFQGPFSMFVERELEARAQGRALPYHLVDDGRYAEKLERYFDVFGRDRVLVLLFDAVNKAPKEVLDEVARFLDVPAGPFQRAHTMVHNFPSRPRNRATRWLLRSQSVAAAARLCMPLRLRVWIGNRLLLRRIKKDDLDPEVGRRLVEVYRPEVEALEHLLGRPLPQLRRTWPRYGWTPEG